MFTYYETYEIKCTKVFNDEEIREIANEYKNYLKEYSDINDIDSFSDFMTYKYYFDINYECIFLDSNMEDFYKEIQKYM